MRPILLFSLFTLFLLSCKSQTYTVDDLPENLLIFGSGGGITGEVTTYTLLENGQIFYDNSLTKEKMEIESLKKKNAASYFKKMDSLKLAEMNFDHPGNLYYFLEEVQGDEKHRVTWGSNNHEIAEECKTLYKELRTSIK